jgi:CxC2 like cysteine cluster associated with KDZ transposases
VEVFQLLSCTRTLQGVLPRVTPAASFSQSLKMGREILYAIVVVEGWGVLAIWALWESMPKSHCALWSFLCFKSHLKTQLQMDFDYEKECKGSNDNVLADEYLAAVDQGTFQLGFGSSKPGQNDKNGDPVITVIDQSGIHEIGIQWCCCPNAPEHNMQLMAAGLFPATF